MALNERILELADRVIVKYPASEQWVFTDEELEKFAELIVRECISIMESAENGYKDYRNQIEDGMRNHCIGLIKHKFDIE